MQFQNLRHRTDGSIEGRYYHETLTDWVAFTAKDGSELWASVYAEPDAVAQLAKAQAQACPAYTTVGEAKAAMVGWIEDLMAQITGSVPKFERESWPVKAAAARAHIAGTARPDQTAMITVEANQSARTVDELAAVIVARADAYETVIARAAGLRVTLDSALEAETDPVNYETILLDGKAQAMTLAADLGLAVS